eukprot:2433019-Pleurochrysis_carterae.AAC.1
MSYKWQNSVPMPPTPRCCDAGTCAALRCGGRGCVRGVGRHRRQRCDSLEWNRNEPQGAEDPCSSLVVAAQTQHAPCPTPAAQHIVRCTASSFASLTKSVPWQL